MRLRISIRGRVRPSVRPSVGPSVRPSVRMSRVIFERRKTSFPMLRWRRNLTWSKRQSRTIYKCHHNVGPWFCPSIRQKKMNKKCRQGRVANMLIMRGSKYRSRHCFLPPTIQPPLFPFLFSFFSLSLCPGPEIHSSEGIIRRKTDSLPFFLPSPR